MKKSLWITALFALCAAGFVAAQEGAGASALPNVSFSTGYVIANYEGVRVENGTARGATRYTDDISFEDEKLFGGLDGGKAINEPNKLIAATAVLNIKEVAPADALKVYVEIAMEGAANSFLGVTGTTHSQVLERLRGKYNFTQKEIADAIRDTVAAAVDAEFNKTGIFMLDRKYNTVLARNPKNGEYTLSYERPSIENDDEELTAASLNALSSEMFRSGDFTQAAINTTINVEATRIPAVVFERAGNDSVKIMSLPGAELRGIPKRCRICGEARSIGSL